MEPLPDPAGASRLAAFRAALGLPAVAIAVVLGVGVALVLDPIFAVPFRVLLGRTLVLAVMLLLVHAAARQWAPGWLPSWLPRWAWPITAVTLAAPLGTVLVYLITVDGDLTELAHPARLMGIAFIAACGMGLGLLVATAAGVRQRLAEARSRELLFELERSRLEKQALDARLALLQAQIEPHFLFNTLANVQALVESGSPRAAQVLASLIAYLRAAMPRLHEGPATLAQEFALVRAYLELMQLRMPDRLAFTLRGDEAALRRPFPPMALLTLVENAVRHGIDPLEEGGSIAIDAQDRGTLWQVTVADTGRGLDPASAVGTGLANLRERLAAFYGGRASLQLEENPPRGLAARIVVESPPG